MKIKVTQEHIHNGRRLSPSSCAVALAIAEQTGAKLVTVGKNEVTLWPNGLATTESIHPAPYHDARLPNEVGMFIEKFDSEKPVDPFEFELAYEVTSNKV